MNIPEYEQRIAPPSDTGDAVNTQALNLAMGKMNATNALAGNLSRFGDAATNAAFQLGDIFQKKHDLSQQAQMMEDLAQYDRNAGSIGKGGEGGVGLLGMLNKNRGELNNWQSTETGDYSDYMKNWEEGQLATLGQGLRGKWRERFELEMKSRITRFAGNVDALATSQAYESIRTSNTNIANNMLGSPDTVNVEASIGEKREQFSEMVKDGIASGVYDPAEGAQLIAQFNEEVLLSHFSAISRDIQDGEPWVSQETGESYDGLDGALDALQDYNKIGLLSDAHVDMLTKSLLDEDNAKFTRGRLVQNEMSTKTFNEMSERMHNGEVFTYNQLAEITRETTSPDHTQFYNRMGDDDLMNKLWKLQDGIINPKGSSSSSDEDFVWPHQFLKLYNDLTKTRDEWQSYVSDNYEKYDIPPEEMLKMMSKQKPVYDQILSSNMNRTLDAKFDPLIKDAKDDEEKERWESLRQSSSFYLLSRISEDEIKTAEDVQEVLDNFMEISLKETIFKDYSSPDRGTNPTEIVGRALQLGMYRGLSGVTPAVAQELARVQDQHKSIISNVYGEDNILETVKGVRGTDMEGRLVFKVQDKYDNNRVKWMVVDVEGPDNKLEETISELPIDDYNPEEGENWVPANGPALAKAEASDSRAEAVADTASTIISAIGGVTPETPPQTQTNFDWYRDNSNGSLINLSDVREYVATHIPAPPDQKEFYDHIYQTAFPEMMDMFINDSRAGTLGIFKRDGSIRANAKRAIAVKLERYGLPYEYADNILQDVFGEQ